MSNVSVDLQQVILHIEEKVDWAERSLARLEHALNQKDAIALQDHFWSFLHASQLLWFYVSRYFTAIGSSGGSAKSFVQNWVTNCLDDNEQIVWKGINELRAFDVHVEPVVTEQKMETRVIVSDAKVLMRDGKILVRQRTQYFVELQGTRYECQELAKQWIRLARRMIEHLNFSAPT